MYQHDDISDPDGSIRIAIEENFIKKMKRITCLSCDEEHAYEPGYGCHFCGRDVRNNELTQVNTPQGLQWLEKTDPSIPLYKRWNDGEIQTYVLEQELAQL